MSELAVGSLKGLAANSFVIDIASGSTLNVPPPAILQVVSVTKTNVYSVSLLSGAIDTQDIPDLTVSITPSSASNKLLVSFNLTMGQQGLIVLRRDGSDVTAATGDVASNRSRVTSAGSDEFQSLSNGTMTFLDDAGSTSATTYSLRLRNNRGSTYDTYINRTGSDTDNNVFGRTISTMTVMEVAG